MNSNRCVEMERLNGETDTSQKRPSRANFCIWFTWSAFFLLATSAIFTFCFFSHHYRLVNGLCDAQATYNISSKDWNWNLKNCHGQLSDCKNWTVCINTDGVYLVDVQIYAREIDTTDFELKTWPTNNRIVAGSYISTKNSSYYVMRANFFLKKENKMKLILNDVISKISTNPENTYWKILKLKA